MIYWMFLGLAIITEVIGTLSMKYASVSGGSAGMIVMYIMIASSYIIHGSEKSGPRGGLCAVGRDRDPDHHHV